MVKTSVKKSPKSRKKVPVIIAQDVSVTYRTYATGKTAADSSGRKGIFRKTAQLRLVEAVKNVSFTVYEGETIGLIGSNGSGKSTLMRAISGLQALAGGAIYANHRPTLLGVGAVLMPKLSGARNVVLGGMAMGFPRKEMESSIKQIARFAGLRKFIDLPMATYSSGMAARLRFSIAAFRDHEILIVDEALSVGDGQFRRRSEARLREMRDNAGTVFLISHSMSSIRDTCDRVLWLEKGELRMDGDTETVVKAYENYLKTLTDD
jgi:teichoic acid transport system ATP-binding protein